MIWNREPALLMALVQAVLGLVLAFGVDLSNEQTGAIMAVTACVLGIVVRQRVTPVNGGESPGPDAPGE